MTQSNITLTEQDAGWIHDCAGRLRLIQTDAAAVSPEKRHGYLQEEITRSVKSLPPANRKRYLEALLTRFPVAGQIAKSIPAAVPPPPAPVAESPDQILDRFLSTASALTEDQRAEMAKRLAQAGFSWVDPNAQLVLESADKRRQQLGLPAGQHPRLDRVMELVVMLIQQFHKLNGITFQILGRLLPKQHPLLRETYRFDETAARFLIREHEPLELRLQRTSDLLAALLGVLRDGGAAIGQQFHDKYSPAAVKDVVEAAGLPLWANKKEHYWGKYEKLSEDIDTPAKIDHKVRACLGEMVELKVPVGR